MFVCRQRLAALSSFSGVIRSTSTTTAVAPTSQSPDTPQDSIFTAPESPWDHVFSDIEPISPPAAQRLRSRLVNNANPANPSTSLPGRQKTVIQHPSPSSNHALVQRGSVVRQRASLTTREISVFDEMFDMIFSAVSAQDGKKPSSSVTRTSSVGGGAHASSTPSIGRTGTPLNDLFRTLRRQSRVRWTTAIDEELDRKKETMELFNTDYDLLQWVTKEVFWEAEQWDEEVKRAVVASREGATKGEKGEDPATASSSSSSLKGGPGKHSIYPHLIAHAMRIFRTTYANPSLSLAIFSHAARVSIPSYVFGCTAPAYNELMEAKWEGWGDLEGVCNALEEMRANGVKIDGRTRIVVERVRREVGEARPEDLGLGTAWEDDHARANDAKDINPLARRIWDEMEEAEVMGLLHRIERLALRDRSRKSTSSPHEESWKNAVLKPAEDDGWSFDGWDREKKPGNTRKQRGKLKSTSRDEPHSRTVDNWKKLGTLQGELAFR